MSGQENKNEIEDEKDERGAQWLVFQKTMQTLKNKMPKWSWTKKINIKSFKATS